MKRTNQLLGLIILVLTVVWSINDSIPSETSSKDLEKATGFSMPHALYHLKNISKKAHFTGSQEHKIVQEYLVTELKKLGLRPEIQVKTTINNKWKASTTTENIIAKIKGKTAGKALLLLSHYDSNPHSSLGASDAGSGVVTILEGVRAFMERNEAPLNDIILVFSDAEELGLLGAQAFVDHHPWAKDIGLVLNFEARGSGGSSYMLMETNGKNKRLLEEFLRANPNHPAANSLMYSVYKILPNDTDLTVFREKGNINGFNFAFIGDHFDYHTAQDSYDRMDRSSLLHQAEYLMSCLDHFSKIDLALLDSDKDLVFVNFPIIKMLSYPFSWIYPMLLFAWISFVVLLFFGFRSEKITLKGSITGFAPFVISLLATGALCFGLWQLLLVIFPQYRDMLHGFTYNGYQYITAFTLMSFWILLKTYRYFRFQPTDDLYIAPIFIGLLLNIAIAEYLPGAAFLIIPVLMAMAILAIRLFCVDARNQREVLIAVLGIPTVYMLAPMIKLFPVGLGLKMLTIAGILSSLLFGWLLPVVLPSKKKSTLQWLVGMAAIFFFIQTSINSGFSVDAKKPNSLVYVQNGIDSTAHWATYNHTLDAYTSQIFDKGLQTGTLEGSEGMSKYNTKYSAVKKTVNRGIKTAKIEVLNDTIIDGKRHLQFSIQPRRKVAKFEFYNKVPLTLSKLCVNGASYKEGAAFEAGKGSLLIYQMANSDKELTLSMEVAGTRKPEILINEISYDLLQHPKFNIKPRDEQMMPMPFVINDAIITTQLLPL